jgi:DNA (cytosine-5)-methyltransferase 1
MNCEGDEGPAVTMFGGIPAFGGHSLGSSIERSATLTAKDTRMDIESETFFVAPTLDASFGRLQGCSGQDANHGHGHLVVHGTQDPDVLRGLAHTLGRNTGQENALLAVPDPGFEACATLDARTHGGGFPGTDGACGGHVIAAFAENSRAEVRLEGGDGSIAGALSGGGGKAGQGMPCIAYSTKLHNTSSNQAGKLYEEYTVSLDASSPPPALLQPAQVRRLTPIECERLQGFPDSYTQIPWRGKPASECPDGPRYKAIGNSKAVTVVRWLGVRLLQQL